MPQTPECCDYRGVLQNLVIIFNFFLLLGIKPRVSHMLSNTFNPLDLILKHAEASQREKSELGTKETSEVLLA
jgi:hypothetical protein